MLAQLLVNGIAVGSVYALIALALVAVYKASDIANFAQGEIAMVALFAAPAAYAVAGGSFAAAIAAALVAAFALGVLLEVLLIRRAKRPSPLNLIILTLGCQLVIFGGAGWKWGAEGRRFEFPLSHGDVVPLGPVVVSHLNLGAIAAAASVMLLLWAFFRFTRTGLAIRATQQDEMAARSNGIATRRMRALSFGIAGAVGAVAALFVAPVASLEPTLMWDPLLKGFAAAVLGGFGSLPGAAVGGYLIGVIESLFGGYVSLEFRAVVPFAVLVLVLWFRPAGLLGRHYVRRV
jgi:branched-chain amino acid transport system permease protein